MSSDGTDAIAHTWHARAGLAVDIRHILTGGTDQCHDICLKDKFAALSIRKGHKKSILALAHNMLRIVFAVLKNKTPYLDKAVDYEALSVQRRHRAG